jgi:hypothetical protein
VGVALALVARLGSAVPIVKPETVIAWHRRSFRLFWGKADTAAGAQTLTTIQPA